jgi:hypothetical protein
MRPIAAACAELVGTLKADGFAVSLDPAELPADVACVWVQPREVRDYTLAGGARLVVWLYLIVPNVETAAALRLLDDALEGVLERYSPADSDDLIDLTASVLLPHTTTPLPAFRVAVDLDL